MPPTVTPGDGGNRCFLSTSSRISHPAFHGALLTNNGNNPNGYSFPVADSRSPFHDDHSSNFPSYPTFISEKEGVPIVCNRYPTSSFQSQGSAPAISPHHSNHRNMNALWSQNQHVTAPSMLQENSNSPNNILSFRATDLNNNNTHSTDYHILNTEKFVPRIIKPRKRRKKDRKPSETLPAPAITRPSPSTERNNPKMFHATTSTLTGGTHTNDRLPNRTEILPPSSVPNLSLDLKMTLWQDHHPPGNHSASSSSEIPAYSTNMICQSLSNILSCGQDISNSKCDQDNQIDEHPAAPFCHLDSDVWDARECGFSSNMMAPITAPQKMIQPTENSVQSPWNNCKNNIVVNLRRSSSEPTSKPVFTNPTINRNRSFSISEREGQNPLGVSSKIVTSHDGHRDIEIKFFSLSSSATKCSNFAESIGSC